MEWDPAGLLGAGAATAHLAAACAYAGFQVTITVLVYPQLAATGRAAPQRFPAYEAAHSRRTAVVVGPLFLALVAATAWLVVGGASPLAWAAAGCTAVVLALTAAAAVPRHDRLRRGWDPAVMAALQRVDAVRAAAAVTQVVLAAVIVMRAG